MNEKKFTTKEEFEKTLIGFFPAFKKWWEQEDIHRESDGSFTAHGLMSSFMFYYKKNYHNYKESSLEDFCQAMEAVVSSDPNDESEVANAICTSFLEMVAGDPPGDRLEPYLGKSCKEFYSVFAEIVRNKN